MEENGILCAMKIYPEIQLMNLKNDLADRIPDAFVIAFLRGEKISVADARNMTE